MKGRGLLGGVSILLIAAGMTSCRVEVKGVEPTRKSQKSGWAVEVREAPLSKPPARVDAQAAAQVGICDPDSSPVMIVVVESPRKVKSAAGLWKATPVVLQDPETVVFADGRIVTSRLDATGEHLQSLGWTHRDIEIVGGLPAAAGAWQRRRG
jgi:hypothetical protein